jgi:hypothetical protein
MATPYGRLFVDDNEVTVDLEIGLSYSVSFWLSAFPVDNTTQHQVYKFEGTAGDFWFWKLTTAGNVGLPNVGGINFSGHPTRAWHHYCIAEASDTMHLYIDGAAYSNATAILTGYYSVAADSLTVGGTAQSMNGVIADFRVYDRKLSASEADDIFDAGLIDTSPITSGLEGRWFIGDDDVDDKSGNGNHGVNSGSVQGDTDGTVIPLPVVPTANAATEIGGGTFLASWTTDDDNASYRIDVSSNVGFTSILASYDDMAISDSPLRVTGLTAMTNYWFRVRGFNVAGTSANSNVVTLTTGAFTTPATPTATAATNIEVGSFTANWSTEGETVSYRLDVSLNSTFSSFLSGYQDLTVSSLSASVTGLTVNTWYYYRVRGVNPAGTSANSNIIAVFIEFNVFDNSNYGRYLLGSPADIVQLETIEISHSNFAATHYFVRNHTEGVTVTLENSNTQAFSYLPMKITEQGTGTDLDFGLLIEFGDLGELLPNDLDAVTTANGLFTEPTLIYRTYRSDDLTSPMVGPIELSVKSFSFNENGATFEAGSDNANSQTTGELYTVSRFPMLRAFT